MKPKAGTEVFELIPSQKMINFMLKYSFFHKQVIQIPMSIVTHTPIDFDVLKKALNIEIERNDCMRLRFYKEHGEFYQYFLDKYVVDDVPVVTFSTEEEQQAYLTADARRPIRHLKGEDFRIIFFRSFDGGYGIYINITHLCMDAAAVFVFFSDLLGVYDHLKNGKPMPRPLGEYKKTIRKELAIVADEKKMKEEGFLYSVFPQGRRSALCRSSRPRVARKRAQKKARSVPQSTVLLRPDTRQGGACKIRCLERGQ